MKKLVGGLFLMCLTIVGISLLILKAQEEYDAGAQDFENMNFENMSEEDLDALLKSFDKYGQEEPEQYETPPIMPEQEENFEQPFEGMDQSVTNTMRDMPVPSDEDILLPDENVEVPEDELKALDRETSQD